MRYDAALVPLHRDPEVIAAATQALTELRERCTFSVALVLTDDGFEIARDPGTGSDDQRLASMSSSLQALGEAITRELKLGEARYALVEAADGHVLLLRVPGHQIVLAAVFDDNETVGKALTVSRHVITDFAASLAA